MAQVVILGLQGEDGLWVADLTSGTVTPLEGDLTGELAATAGLRSAGVSTIKSVDYAVAVSSADAVATGHFES